MKIWQIVYSIITLIFAGMLFISAISWFFVIVPAMDEGTKSPYFIGVFASVLTVFLGAGGILAFVRNKFFGWPAGLMIAGYALSMWLLPMSFWAGIAWIAGASKSGSGHDGATPRDSGPL